ncbi:hypothetical protein [Lentilactobacillus kribbianus]|uniref:hypothetical protein n=1 Tax=Lentilactobacillus kribbianus TaxID=2729622 RepID=UPI00155165D3|nr:hypothetical protein [Lentilactobacillus kribbianus]
MLMPLIFNGLLLSTSVTADTALKDNIPYLVTHGHALGVASNFNIFATNNYMQSSSVSNVRLAAGYFQSKGWQQSIGWTKNDDRFDSHMLVVKKRADDANTNSTFLNTDQSSGIYAAEDSDALPMKNTKDQPNDNSYSVKPDALSDVSDFTDNGVTSFSDATKQSQEVSDFYNSKDALTKAFSADFLNYTTLDQDQIKTLHDGKKIVIKDDNAKKKFLVINIPITNIDQLRLNTLSLNIEYQTKLTETPIVVLNFPNLTNGFELYSNDDALNVTYGTADNQTRISDKQHLLLNFPSLDETTPLAFDQQFLGTIMAPKGKIIINSLNSVLTSMMAKDIEVHSSVNTAGPDGIFNPPDFADPNNHGDGDDKPESKVTATVDRIDTTGQKSSAALEDAKQLGYFMYKDKAVFNIEWSNAKNTQLYRSDDYGATWEKVSNSSADGSGSYSSINDYRPAQRLSWNVSADQKTLTAQATKNIRFELATESPNTDGADKIWFGDTELNMAKFSLTVPATINFSNLDADDKGVIKPTITPQIKVNNALDVPFNLKLIVDAQSSGNSPTDSSNIFLGARQFTFNNTDLNNLTSIFGMNQASADQFIKDMATTPLEEAGKTYDLTGFQLNTNNQRFVAATAGLKWQFDWGSE